MAHVVFCKFNATVTDLSLCGVVYDSTAVCFGLHVVIYIWLTSVLLNAQS